MDIEWTYHAKLRLQQRGITEAEVVEALRNHHTSMPGRPSGMKYVGETNAGVSLQVITDGNLEDGGSVKIITAYRRDA